MLKNCSNISGLLGFEFPESLKEAAKEEISTHNDRKVLFLFEGWDDCPQDCAIVHKKIVDVQELPWQPLLSLLLRAVIQVDKELN